LKAGAKQASFRAMSNVGEQLSKIARNRILVIDGAMGTSIQGFGLQEADYRGTTFEKEKQDLKGNNELLSITRPDVIGSIHEQFLAAGADIIETNTFNANRLSQADYHLESAVYDLNIAAVHVARQAALKFSEKTPNKPRYVAGALGPTNRTLTISPDVNDPGFRAVSYDQVYEAYLEQALALIDGGVDILLAETVFDTLNLKAALQAIEAAQAQKGTTLPLMVSVTFSDKSGRTMSGQTVGAFWDSIAYCRLFSV